MERKGEERRGRERKDEERRRRIEKEITVLAHGMHECLPHKSIQYLSKAQHSTVQCVLPARGSDGSVRGRPRRDAQRSTRVVVCAALHPDASFYPPPPPTCPPPRCQGRRCRLSPPSLLLSLPPPSPPCPPTELQTPPPYHPPCRPPYHLRTESQLPRCM